MTEQDINEMIELSAPLVTEPKPWDALSAEQQVVFLVLMPEPSFTDEQRFWLRQWWLPVSSGQLASLNADTPDRTRIEGRADAGGNLFISADLLSDALDDGPLSDLLPILSTLPLTFSETISWPVAAPVSPYS